MFKRVVIGIILATSTAVITVPRIVLAAGDAARMQQVEERVRGLETRMADVEATMHAAMPKQPGKHGVQSAMGQKPQTAPGMSLAAAPSGRMGGGGTGGGGMGGGSGGMGDKPMSDDMGGDM